MGKYFGTDGYRGEANVVLTPNNAFKIGRFLGWYYGKEHPDGRASIAIGKDTRRSSYMFEDALAAGITASGSDAYLLHVTTTPSVSFVVRTENFDCGIMISASHNPFYDNGIKIIRANGQKIEPEIERMIERYIDDNIPDIPLALRDAIGRTVDFYAGRNRYIGYLISIPTCSFKSLKVGLDCANGSASQVAKNVFDALGAKTYVINAEPDGTNINKDCGSTHISALQEHVKKNQLDLGFAYDGDADRCIAVDANGEVVDGDRIMFICGKHLKEQGKLKEDTIVTTVMSNIGLYKAFEREGIRNEITPVGDKYVAEKMLENGYRLGGEQSGHIIFGKYATTGDGILTSLMVVQSMLDQKATLAQLAKEVTIYPQLLVNVPVNDKDRAMKNESVLDAIAKAEGALADEGRLLVRPSGTELCIRVMAEAKTDETCGEVVGSIVEVMKKEGLTATE